MELKESAQRVEVKKYNIYRTLQVLLLIIFGMLIEYKRIIFAFKDKIAINKYYFMAGVGLLIMLVLPMSLYLN
jgi:hypothetical protein